MKLHLPNIHMTLVCSELKHAYVFLENNLKSHNYLGKLRQLCRTKENSRYFFLASALYYLLFVLCDEKHNETFCKITKKNYSTMFFTGLDSIGKCFIFCLALRLSVAPNQCNIGCKISKLSTFVGKTVRENYVFLEPV